MSRIIPVCIVYLGALMTCASPLYADEPLETQGDASSNVFQQDVDENDNSPNNTLNTIQDENFDSSDGGLYCPNNECDKDPSDAANGF